MSDRREKARELRAQGKGVLDIAKLLGVSRSTVSDYVKGMPDPRVTWHDKAREMRRSGIGLREIAKALGKSRPHVSEVCKDIRLPGPTEEDKAARYERRKLKMRQRMRMLRAMRRAELGLPDRAPRAPRPEPAWWEQAREMRRAEKTLAEIGAALGKGVPAVSHAVRGIKVDFKGNQMRKWAEAREQKKVARVIARASRPKRERSTPYVQTPEEKRYWDWRQKIAKAIANDPRPPAPITLPKLAFMERSLVA